MAQGRLNTVDQLDEVLAERTLRDPLTGCLVWTGGRARGGYPALSVGGKSRRVHRLVMERMVGRSLSSSEFVCHRCDNPPCCEIDHLFIGSVRDNVADQVAKGRQRRGEAINTARLSREQVEEIRRRYAAGDVSQDRLAVEYGIRQATVWQIIHRRSWR